MKEYLEYKGYYGSVDFSAEDEIFHGKLAFIRALVTYEGDSFKSIRTAFEAAVDDYLVMCEEECIEAEKPFKGSFNVRIDPIEHREAYMMAIGKGLNLNEFVRAAIHDKIKKETKSRLVSKKLRKTVKGTQRKSLVVLK